MAADGLVRRATASRQLLPGRVGKFVGATRRYETPLARTVVSIVGASEVDLDCNYISWVSSLARPLMKKIAGERVVLLRAPRE